MYCDFTPDKRYQLADWRIRPLPAPMLDYARSDTHYLLYIYDHLRNALLDRGASRSRSASPTADDARPLLNPHDLLKEAISRSAMTALRTHQREVYDMNKGSGPSGWEPLARKWNKLTLLPSPDASVTQRVQSAVYLAIHGWRDRTAREEDENTRWDIFCLGTSLEYLGLRWHFCSYILPNHYLFQIAEQHPADMATLLNIFRPVPPIIRRRARELLDTIKDAVAEALGGTNTATAAEPRLTVHESAAIVVDDVKNMVAENEVSDNNSVAAGTANLWCRGNFSRPLIPCDQNTKHCYTIPQILPPRI
jgi:exosome complex exonuclease RRP6